ncbi:uncharacterized protein LOC116844342 isoform X2 [Odontomachus brunneus]|uniref:uncharacterized protein LOC116844342 isoform X2 n=1 Tax=Odontomachus brunneus TaxID=486640 RepID=UPI0013F208B8|nr:uncharacterized protein LOC116844342 isoform X2 [Odontomachus brunneus]
MKTVPYGGMRQIQVETETEDIEVLREILEEERQLLYGKALDPLILEVYYESQACDKTYREYLNLDNILPYIPVYTHLSSYSLTSMEAQRTFLLGQKMDFTY